MWTDGAAGCKRRGRARACVVLSAFSPTAALANASVHVKSLVAGVEDGRRDTITTRVLAAVERGVGDLQDTLREVSLAGRHRPKLAVTAMLFPSLLKRGCAIAVRSLRATSSAAS